MDLSGYQAASINRIDTEPIVKKSITKRISTKSFTVEKAKAQKIRIRQESPYGMLKSWNLIRIMVKANDDVRQE